MPRLVVFDIDGTLLHLGDAVAEAYSGAFAALGIRDVCEDWSAYASGSDVGIAREVLSGHFGRPCTEAELGSVLDRYLERLRAIPDLASDRHLVPGVRTALALLAGRGVRLALATGNLRRGSEVRLGAVGLWERFECGAFGEDGDHKTPILERALERCGERWPGDFDRSRALYVGDQPVDAEAARRCGVPFVGAAESHYRDLDAFLARLEDLWGGAQSRPRV